MLQSVDIATFPKVSQDIPIVSLFGECDTKLTTTLIGLSHLEKSKNDQIDEEMCGNHK